MNKRNRAVLEIYKEGVEEQKKKTAQLIKELEYRKKIQEATSLRKEIQNFDGEVLDLSDASAFLDKVSSFYSFYRAPKVNIRSELTVDIQNYRVKTKDTARKLTPILKKVRRGLEKRFSKLYAELKRWRNTKNLSKVEELRAELDETASIFDKFNSVLGQSRKIKRYLQTCPQEKRKDLDEKIEKLRDFYFSNASDVEALKREQKKNFNGFLERFGLSEGKLIQECKKHKYYEGAIKARKAREEINYLIANSSRASEIELEAAKIKNKIECVKNLAEIVQESLTEQEIHEIENLKSKAFALAANSDPYLREFAKRNQNLIREFRKQVAEVREKAYENLVKEISSVKKNPTERDVKKTLNLCYQFRRIYNIDPEIEELETLEDTMLKKRTASEYRQGGLTDFFKKPIPNKFEFYKIRDVMNGELGLMEKRIDAVKELARKIKLKGQEELDYLKALWLALREDSRKGYIAHCIDYDGLPEEKVSGLLRSMEFCMKS